MVSSKGLSGSRSARAQIARRIELRPGSGTPGRRSRGRRIDPAAPHLVRAQAPRGPSPRWPGPRIRPRWSPPLGVLGNLVEQGVARGGIPERAVAQSAQGLGREAQGLKRGNRLIEVCGELGTQDTGFVESLAEGLAFVLNILQSSDQGLPLGL